MGSPFDGGYTLTLSTGGFRRHAVSYVADIAQYPAINARYRARDPRLRPSPTEEAKCLYRITRCAGFEPPPYGTMSDEVGASAECIRNHVNSRSTPSGELPNAKVVRWICTVGNRRRDFRVGVDFLSKAIT